MKEFIKINSQTEEPESPFKEPTTPEPANPSDPYPVTDPIAEPSPEPFPAPPEPTPTYPPDVIF